MMNLSSSQLATLKNWVIANNAGAFDESAVALLNVDAAPDFIVWRTSVAFEEVMQNGFDWSRVNNLTVGKARTWEWLEKFGKGFLNPSKPNTRAGIDDTWVGSAPDLAVRAAIYVHCKRKATVGEKLFATGTGSDAVPATMGPEGPVTYDNVVAADS